MSVNVKKFIEAALLLGLRNDGRNLYDYRKLTIKFGSTSWTWSLVGCCTWRESRASGCVLAGRYLHIVDKWGFGCIVDPLRPESLLGGEDNGGSPSTRAVRVSGDAGHGSAVVVGTVYCDTCFQQGFSKTSHFLSGASVAVECSNGPIGETYRQEAKTNNLGEFSVNLPFWVGKHVRKIKSCSVELISSNHPNCSVASTASSTSIYLQLHRQGTRIFSAGFFTFKPLKLPNLCNEPSVEVSSSKALIPPNLDPTFLLPLKKLPTIIPPLPGAGLFTPLPFLPKLPPLPQLPPLPSLPSLPKQPPSSPRETTMPRNFNSGSKPDHTASDQKTVNTEFFLPPAPSTFQQQPSFPTNPFKPPPAPLIPLPPIPGLNPTTPPAAFTFQPSFPTNPFQPSPAPLIPLPPIPGMTPTTPPEALTFPFPPFSFPPLTPFRGIPAAATSSSSPSSSPLVTSSP